MVKNWVNDGFEWVFFVIPILLSFNLCDCVGTGFIRYELVELDKIWVDDGFEWVFFVIPILLSFNRCDCVGTGFIRYELVQFDKNGFILILLGSNRYYFIISSYHNI